ncbi:MAG: hypothetical protein ABIX10_02390 [Acidimicrobiales bacterium]
MRRAAPGSPRWGTHPLLTRWGSSVGTGGRRARPPEDCGGVSGYQNVLAVLAGAADEEHASMLEWVGSGFDPDGFDPSEFAGNLKVGSLLEP